MQRRLWLGLIISAGLLGAACSDDPQTKSRHNVNPDGTPAGTSGSSGAVAGSTTPTISCPADVAAPVQLAPDTEASDVRIVGNDVFFRVGTKLVRVKKDGTGRSDVYSSPDLIRTFTDGKTVVAVESPDPPNAVLRVTTVGGDPNARTEIGTNRNAASVIVFAVDATNIYAVADQDNGDTIYRASKEGGDLGELANTGGVVSDPQLVGGSIWYVKDQKEVYKLTPGGEGAAPVLVFTADAGCSLAVGTSHVYCSAAGVLEQRDLTGANAKKLFDTATSKVPAAFGTVGLASGDSIVVRSSGSTPLKSVLRGVGAAGDEHVIACGRDAIGSLAADGVSAAWVENGKGVFFGK